MKPCALELRRSRNHWLLERGYAFGQAGDFRSASEDLTRVLRVDPANAPALTLRGAAYAKLGLSAKAIDDFTNALKLTPDDAKTSFGPRHFVRAADGRNREALTDREAAVLLLPKFPEALLARGGSYHALGMHAQGLADRSEGSHSPELQPSPKPGAPAAALISCWENLRKPPAISNVPCSSNRIIRKPAMYDSQGASRY